MKNKLDTEIHTKEFHLKEQKEDINNELEFLRQNMNEISKQMITMSEAAIVQSTPNFKSHLLNLNNRPLPKFKKDPELFLFSVDSVLSQEEATFILRPFSVLKERGETAYSEPLVINGITWRLKVYPNGNGSVKGTYMSVFVEMVQGWGNEVGSYEYRVEMINYKDPRKVITREFVSEFESSVSWGYNRFFKLEWMAKEGYLDTEKDEVVLKYYISPSNEVQLISDLKKYIKYLEGHNTLIKQESEGLRTQLNKEICTSNPNMNFSVSQVVKEKFDNDLTADKKNIINEVLEFKINEENFESSNENFIVNQELEYSNSKREGIINEDKPNLQQMLSSNRNKDTNIDISDTLNLNIITKGCPMKIDDADKFEDEIMTLKQLPNELIVERGSEVPHKYASVKESMNKNTIDKDEVPENEMLVLKEEPKIPMLKNLKTLQNFSLNN